LWTRSKSCHSIRALAKKIRKNSRLNQELYDSIDLRSIQYSIEAGLKNYFEISQFLVVYHQLRGGVLINDNLFLNELYRLGGLNTLRGFNENFFFASHYALSNLETRLYIESKSYLFVFYDQSFLSFDVNENDFQDFPLGVGVGVSLGLKAGVFNFVYAIGRSDDQPFTFSLSKIHFGYISTF